jgi:hypothetical protein
LGDKNKSKKVVQLDKPKPVTNVAPTDSQPQQKVLPKQENKPNMQDLLTAKLQELSLQEPAATHAAESETIIKAK